MDDKVFDQVTLRTVLELNYAIKSDKALNGQQTVVRRERDMLENPCHWNNNCNYRVVFMDCNMPVMDRSHTGNQEGA